MISTKGDAFAELIRVASETFAASAMIAKTYFIIDYNFPGDTL